MAKAKSSVACFEREMLRSKAYTTLTGASPIILAGFYCKRRLQQVKVGKRTTYEVTNNGEIVFTYREAHDIYRLSKPRFTRALDQLIDHGFIDVAVSGAQLWRQCNLYAISERWRLFGTPDFESKPRPKGRGRRTAALQDARRGKSARDLVAAVADVMGVDQ